MRIKTLKAILTICYVFFILNVFSQKLREWPSTPMAKEKLQEWVALGAKQIEETKID